MNELTSIIDFKNQLLHLSHSRMQSRGAPGHHSIYELRPAPDAYGSAQCQSQCGVLCRSAARRSARGAEGCARGVVDGGQIHYGGCGDCAARQSRVLGHDVAGDRGAVTETGDGSGYGGCAQPSAARGFLLGHWGCGAGVCGKMRQTGKMWLLWPRGVALPRIDVSFSFDDRQGREDGRLAVPDRARNRCGNGFLP